MFDQPLQIDSEQGQSVKHKQLGEASGIPRGSESSKQSSILHRVKQGSGAAPDGFDGPQDTFLSSLTCSPVFKSPLKGNIHPSVGHL